MVFTGTDLDDESPYEDYDKFLDNFLEIPVTIAAFKLYKARAVEKVTSLKADRPYLVFFYRERHWKIGKHRLPRLASTAFSLDRFDGFNGHRTSQCLFNNCSHPKETYGRDWFVVELI